MDYIPSFTIPESVIGYTVYAITWVPVLVAIYYLRFLAMWIYETIMAQRVTGKANQWVVRIRDGEQVMAGVGLSCFKSPFESVAIFSSKLTKVEVTTQQVTKEFQGVEVKSMIQWTVDRKNPLKAFKMLDLAGGDYRNANDTLSCMTSAIVRNQVANSTMDHIIKNRKELREVIMKEMTSVVEGWGVHLSTVEVLEVKICSGKLFKDMQSKFREENVKKATIEKMLVENTISFDALQKEQLQKKRFYLNRVVETKAQLAEQLAAVKRSVKEFKVECMLGLRSQERQAEQQIVDKNHALTLKLKAIERDIAAHIATVDVFCHRENSDRDKQSNDLETCRARILEHFKNEKISATSAREIKQGEYDMLKLGFKDPVVSKLKFMEAVGDLYQTMDFGKFAINHMGSDDPIAHIISTFTQMVEGEQTD